jgi:probable HAF family extracellular repeat protein
MKSRTLTCITAVTLFAALAVPVRLATQEQNGNRRHRHHRHHRYRFVDMGTLGGLTSYGSAGGAGNLIINNRGTVAGSADTSTPDPHAPNCFNLDCFLSHTFRWQDGGLTDLGALPGANGSAASGINARGWITGYSGNGIIDPLLGIPETRAVLWNDDQIIDLGTLGGYESVGIAVNNRGQVTGFATNATPDPFSGFGTQVRAFLWEDGVMQDLGTLGGPDSPPLGNTIINESGQIAGSSNTDSTPNPLTGNPTTDPFLWENGTMTDLGTLGGTVGFPVFLNNRAEVVGQSNLAGDVTAHPFLWHRGTMTDLGTLGGTFGVANWINDAGEVVGQADTPTSSHAFFYRHGKMTDLGTLSGDCFSVAVAINSGSQIVGQSFSCDFSTARAFIWENGSMTDLNTLIPPNSSLQLVIGFNINDRGEIVGVGTPPGVQDFHFGGRLFLLIPCDEDHGDSECEDEGEGTAVSVGETNQKPNVVLPENVRKLLRQRMAQRYHIRGFGALPGD